MISENHQEIFRYFCKILTENNIPYFLVAGSLLGAIRERKPLDHDTDFDIGIYDEYYEDVRTLLSNTQTAHGFYIYNLWRKEITLIKQGYSKNESQIDLFFIERTKEGSYIYANKFNFFSGIWDIEWRFKFNPNVFDELISYSSFLPNITVQIPKNYEEILTGMYGDWKTPNKTWQNTDAPAYDKNYRQIAVIITTFLRDNCLKNIVDSIQNTWDSDWYRLYIVDQGIYTPEKEVYYGSLRDQGHVCEYLPFNSGLSRSRNLAIDNIKEPYILLLDDDFIINKNTKIQNFVDVLLTDPAIGVVGGRLENHENYHYQLYLSTPDLYYVLPHKKLRFLTFPSMIKPSTAFMCCDIVLNFAMFKQEVFEDHRWDDDLKLVEHSDFYLRLKNNNKWQVTFTDTVSAEHDKDKNTSEYNNFRKKINSQEGYDKFIEKWKLGKDKIKYLKGTN